MSNNIQKPEFQNISEDPEPQPSNIWSIIQSVMLYVMIIGKASILFVVGVFFSALAIHWLGSLAFLAPIFMIIMIIMGIYLEHKAQSVIKQKEEEEK